MAKPVTPNHWIRFQALCLSAIREDRRLRRDYPGNRSYRLMARNYKIVGHMRQVVGY